MTLLVSGIALAANFYLAWRLTYATICANKPRWMRWLPTLFLLSFYALPLVGFLMHSLHGNVDMLELPKPLTYWFWFGLVFSFQLATWVIVCDALFLASRWWGRWPDSKIKFYYSRALGVLFILVFLFSCAKMYHDTHTIRVEEKVLSINNIPESFEGLKVIHISDIQGDQYTGAENIARYVEEVNRQNPDLVIFTGDLISYGTDFVEMSAREFSGVESRYGVFAVAGDHDYWAGLSTIEPALEQYGIEMLRDENEIIMVEKDSLFLTGITHVYSQSAEQQVVDSLTSVVDDFPLKIMASHQISELLIERAQQNSYNMLLAGHTHGGQIRVPFLGMQFSAADRETEFVGGSYWMDELLIHVNNGLGFTLGPVRYNAPPTVSVIILEAR